MVDKKKDKGKHFLIHVNFLFLLQFFIFVFLLSFYVIKTDRKKKIFFYILGAGCDDYGL